MTNFVRLLVDGAGVGAAPWSGSGSSHKWAVPASQHHIPSYLVWSNLCPSYVRYLVGSNFIIINYSLTLVFCGVR